jgi:capsular polysaccharide biosynthesis protein
VSWQYFNGSVLSETEKFFHKKKLLINHPPKFINGTVISLLTGGGGRRNYFHWLFDCLPRLRIAETICRPDGSTKYFIPEDTYPFQKETLEALGISTASCISSKKYQHLQATNLIATSHPRPPHSPLPRWIVSFLRESFLKFSSSLNQKSFVYISRGDSFHSRKLINEENLSIALESAGFGIYRLSELAFLDQVSLFSRARMIVGSHGAGFANLAFASKGAVVYEIFSEQFQPDVYESLSLLAGLDYYKIVCEASEPGKPFYQADFRLPETSIITILKHAEQIAAVHD